MDWHQRQGDNFLRPIITMDEIWARSYEPNLKCQWNEWKHPDSPRPKNVHPTQSAVKVMFIVVHDIDGLILHHAVPQRQSTAARSYSTTFVWRSGENDNTWWRRTSSFFMTMQGFIPRCHGPLAPLTMGDAGTSTVVTQYESMRLWYLCQSERTTARDPVQHKRWTYPCYRAVNMEYHQRWTNWCCTMPSKHLAKGDKQEGDYIEGT